MPSRSRWTQVGTDVECVTGVAFRKLLSRRFCGPLVGRARLMMDRYREDLEEALGKGLRDGGYTRRTERDLSRAVRNLRATSEVVDAGEYVSDHVLRSTRARVVDLPLKNGDLPLVQERILGLFREGRVPRRGFVYVAWSRSPTRYFYAGKAGGVRRLDLAGHGKLAHAIARATRLSLLFPSRSSATVLAGVEASVLTLIEASEARLPDLNVRREPVPHGVGARKLEYLSLFLADAARRLDPARR